MNEKTTSIVDEVEMHGQTVKRFQSLCDMHRVPFGEPGNLNDFITNLQQNRHFAMDFWAMVGEVSARERGTLADEEMLEAIVEGSSGLTLAAAEKDYEKPLQELKQMLAGVDITAPDLPAPIAEPEDELLFQEKLERERVFAKKVLQRKNAQSFPELRIEPPSDSSETITHHTIAEALQRLEQSNRELREQIAAMQEPNVPVATPESEEQFIKQIKQNDKTVPNNQSIAGTESPQTPQVPRIVEVPFPSEQEVFAPRSVHRFSRRGLILSDPDDDPSIGVPLAAYSEEHPRGKAIRIGIPVLLLLLAVASWFAISRGYGQQWVERYTPWVKAKLVFFQQEVHDLVGNKSQNPAVTQPVSGTTAPANQTSEQSTPAPPPVQQPNPENENKAVPEAQNQDQTEPIPQQQSEPVPAIHSVPAKPPSNQGQPALEELEQGAVRVSSSAMEENLMVSRVPVYPENARAMGIHGTVVVETIISPSGTVEFARAISGDSHLYAAAEESVLKWRYKPYFVSGRAMKVVTQVRVVFRLSE